MDGLLIVDKPTGPTSHDVVARLRRTLDQRRIGHTGTLDPTASGVLPLVIGRATRLARFLSGATKEYRAAIRLGVATDTYDAAGTITSRHEGPLPKLAAIEAALDAFRGTTVQRPPAYSAKKIAGERSHHLARRAAAMNTVGERPEAVEVTAFRIEVIAVAGGIVEVDVECSAGFYVRSLAHDLGEQLGVGAHLETLCRTRSGEWQLTDARRLQDLEKDRAAAMAAIVPMRQMLAWLPAVHLTLEGARLARHGRVLGPQTAVSGWVSALIHPEGSVAPVRLVDPEGELVGLGRAAGGTDEIHPFIVLASDLM